MIDSIQSPVLLQVYKKLDVHRKEKKPQDPNSCFALVSKDVVDYLTKIKLKRCIPVYAVICCFSHKIGFSKAKRSALLEYYNLSPKTFEFYLPLLRKAHVIYQQKVSRSYKGTFTRLFPVQYFSLAVSYMIDEGWHGMIRKVSAHFDQLPAHLRPKVDISYALKAIRAKKKDARDIFKEKCLGKNSSRNTSKKSGSNKHIWLIKDDRKPLKPQRTGTSINTYDQHQDLYTHKNKSIFVNKEEITSTYNEINGLNENVLLHELKKGRLSPIQIKVALKYWKICHQWIKKHAKNVFAYLIYGVKHGWAQDWILKYENNLKGYQQKNMPKPPPKPINTDSIKAENIKIAEAAIAAASFSLPHLKMEIVGNTFGVLNSKDPNPYWANYDLRDPSFDYSLNSYLQVLYEAV